MNTKIYLALVLLILTSGFAGCKTVKKTELVVRVDVANKFVADGSSPAKVLKDAARVIDKRLESYFKEKPHIDVNASSNTIRVSVVGEETDPSQIVRLLEQRGEFEIREAYSSEEAFPMLQSLNDALASGSGNTEQKYESKEESQGDTASLGATMRESERLKAEGERAFKAKNPLFAIMLPSVSGAGELNPGPVVGYVTPNDTARFNGIINGGVATSIVGGRVAVRYGNLQKEGGIEVYAVRNRPSEISNAIAGSHVASAVMEKDPILDEPSVVVKLNQSGTIKFTKMTGANINKFLAVVFDGKVMSAPRVMGEITGGTISFMGHYDAKTAKRYAAIVNSGALPAPVKVTGIQGDK